MGKFTMTLLTCSLRNVGESSLNWPNFLQEAKTLRKIVYFIKSNTKTKILMYRVAIEYIIIIRKETAFMKKIVKKKLHMFQITQPVC